MKGPSKLLYNCALVLAVMPKNRRLGQARKSRAVASKTAANRSYKRVTCHPTTASIFWPATGRISLTRRVTKMTPHVLILPASSMGRHPFFA